MNKTYKVILMFTFFIIISSSILQALENKEGDSVNWTQIYAEAALKAKEQNKVLFVYFSGSDWCYWCKKLHTEVLTQKAFTDFAGENFVLLLCDFPKKTELPPHIKKQNKALAKKYNVKGVPTIILLDSTEKMLGRTGYREGGAETYIEHLKGFLKKEFSPLSF
ncbi:thioredoxin family protein [Candidatus Riflebacteria bacterium]